MICGPLFHPSLYSILEAELFYNIIAKVQKIKVVLKYRDLFLNGVDLHHTGPHTDLLRL